MNEIIIIVISVFIFFISMFFALKTIKKDKGEYECLDCKNIIEPSFKEIVYSIYSDDTRFLKCPNCGKKTWHKKVKR